MHRWMEQQINVSLSQINIKQSFLKIGKKSNINLKEASREVNVNVRRNENQTVMPNSFASSIGSSISLPQCH